MADLRFTEDQLELASIVESLLDKRSDSTAVRKAVESDAGYDESLWQALCEQVGVAALPVPEQYDGAGAGFGETIRSINGDVECNGGSSEGVTSRVNFFQRFCQILGVSFGNNLSC